MPSGRPTTLTDETLDRINACKNKPIAAIAPVIGVTKATIYRWKQRGLVDRYAGRDTIHARLHVILTPEGPAIPTPEDADDMRRILERRRRQRVA